MRVVERFVFETDRSLGELDRIGTRVAYSFRREVRNIIYRDGSILPKM